MMLIMILLTSTQNNLVVIPPCFRTAESAGWYLTESTNYSNGLDIISISEI